MTVECVMALLGFSEGGIEGPGLQYGWKASEELEVWLNVRAFA